MIGAALFVFTAITVAANQIHLVVPLAITVALIIAAMKGSMVAAVFMHLSHEKSWIYGALLLTVAFFIVLMFVPLVDDRGRYRHCCRLCSRAGDARRRTDQMSLRGVSSGLHRAVGRPGCVLRRVGDRPVSSRASAGVRGCRRCVARWRVRSGAVRNGISTEDPKLVGMRIRFHDIDAAWQCRATLLACPVCFGQNDSPLASAMNMGIFAMLVVTVGVLVAFASFFIHLIRRARLAESDWARRRIPIRRGERSLRAGRTRRSCLMLDYLGLPVAASAHAGEIDQMIVLVHWLMLVMFVGWGALLPVRAVPLPTRREPKASYSGAKGKFAKGRRWPSPSSRSVLLVFYAIPAWATRVRDFRRRAKPPSSESSASSSRGTCSTPAPTASSGGPTSSSCSADNPLGLDRNDPDAKDDITTINQLNVPVDRPVLVHLIEQGRHPQLRPLRDAREAGRGPRPFDSSLVHPEPRRRIRDRLLAALWSRPLPDAWLRHHPERGRLQQVDGGPGERAQEQQLSSLIDPHHSHNRCPRGR